MKAFSKTTMNIAAITRELSNRYPGRPVIASGDRELICEVDPTSDHSEYSVAIAVIEQSAQHIHKVITEEYEILQGELELTVDSKKYVLQKGESYTIQPGQIHSAKGDVAWVKVTARPGWTLDDHILVQNS